MSGLGRLLAGVGAGLLLAPPLAAQLDPGPLQRFDPTQQVGIDQRLGEVVPGDIELVDEAGLTLRFEELFEPGRPVVLALVYYECPMLCGEVFQGLLRGLRPLGFDAGGEYTFCAVSIDPGEAPELAAAKREALLEQYGRGPEARDGFRLLTGDPEAIDRLATAVGFRYVYDERADEFAHAGGLMVLTPERELSRYFYGVEFAPRDLRLALVEAADGGIGTLVDRVLLLCTHWDPAVGAYGLAIQGALRVGGVLTVLGIAGFVALSLRRESRGARSMVTEGRG